MTILWFVLGVIVADLHIQAYRSIFNSFPLPVRLVLASVSVVLWPVQPLPVIHEVILAYEMRKGFSHE